MQHRISVKAVLALAVTAPALLVVLTPASGLASTVRPFAVPNSPNYAGWLAGAPNAHGDPSASSAFIVPTVTGCTTTTDDFVVVGIGLPSATSIIATGVAVGCKTGAPFYTAETDIDGTITPVPVTVTPGDKIVLKLKVTGTTTVGSFVDVTKGFNQPIKGNGGKSTGSCIGIDGSEGGTSDPPVPNFGRVVFSSGSINGTTITKSGAVRVNMATAAGVVQISTGRVNAAGTGFTSVFKNTGG